MIRTLAIAAAAFFSASSIPAAAEDFAGTYDGSQTELAAVLELGGDGRYAYRLAYGAIDEVSQGTWEETDGGVFLTSDPVVAPTFEHTASVSGPSGGLSVRLDTERLPPEAFSALVNLADGSVFAVDFGPDGLDIPLEPGERVARIMLALPMFEVRSPEFTVEPGVTEMAFRFTPNDLGVLALDRAFLPLREGALLLQRFDRTLAFRKVSP